MNARPPSRLLIFARYPRPGQVKTRLFSLLDELSASDLYRAFLIDTLQQVASLPTNIERRLLVADRHDVGAMRSLVADEGFGDMPVEAQSVGDLGRRLHHALGSAIADGVPMVCAIGSDHPTLPIEFVASAFAQPPEVDVVMGPTDDGGYYLIGMRRLHEALILNMPYSTAELANDVRRRGEDLRLLVAELPPWYDVDNGQDLRRLVHERGAAGERTRRLLTSLVEQGRIDGNE